MPCGYMHSKTVRHTLRTSLSRFSIRSTGLQPGATLAAISLRVGLKPDATMSIKRAEARSSGRSPVGRRPGRSLYQDGEPRSPNRLQPVSIPVARDFSPVRPCTPRYQKRQTCSSTFIWPVFNRATPKSIPVAARHAVRYIHSNVVKHTLRTSLSRSLPTPTCRTRNGWPLWGWRTGRTGTPSSWARRALAPPGASGSSSSSGRRPPGPPPGS